MSVLRGNFACPLLLMKNYQKYHGTTYFSGYYGSIKPFLVQHHNLLDMLHGASMFLGCFMYIYHGILNMFKYHLLLKVLWQYHGTVIVILWYSEIFIRISLYIMVSTVHPSMHKKHCILFFCSAVKRLIASKIKVFVYIIYIYIYIYMCVCTVFIMYI